MADLSIIVSEIEIKLRKMIENKRIAEEKEALEKESLALKRSVMELEERINKNTIVNALDKEEEIEEGRRLIREMVKEIDRCVSILNSKE